MKGFTLIETMVAISLLTVSVVAPMLLTVQALNSAYYARDQITASYLAQEGLEGVHQIRDDNILTLSQNISGSQCSPVTLFCGIPIGQDFRIDVPQNDTIALCSSDGLPQNACEPLQTDGILYGYQNGGKNSIFTRTLYACYIQGNGTCSSSPSDEVRLTVAVSWQTGNIQKRTVTLSENLYRWVQDGAAASP